MEKVFSGKKMTMLYSQLIVAIATLNTGGPVYLALPVHISIVCN